MATASRALVLSDAQPDNRSLPLALVRRDLDVSVQLGPGRLLNQAYASIGRAAEKGANRMAHKFGMGPIALTDRIDQALCNLGKDRNEMLDKLHDYASGTSDDRSFSKLEKDCRKLMKYALPLVPSMPTDPALNMFTIDVQVRSPSDPAGHFQKHRHVIHPVSRPQASICSM